MQDAQGGQLRGGALIDALVNADFKGVIVSVSGDAVSCEDHLGRGAHVVWSKPLVRPFFSPSSPRDFVA